MWKNWGIIQLIFPWARLTLLLGYDNVGLNIIRADIGGPFYAFPQQAIKEIPLCKYHSQTTQDWTKTLQLRKNTQQRKVLLCEKISAATTKV